MNLYISADIEGIAGVATRDQGAPGAFEYDNGRKWMTGEVRAVCEGARDAGVADILISDSHGNGQSLLLDELPDDVRVVRSWPRPLGMMEGIQSGEFAAAMLIGYHAGATSVSGTLAHTMYGVVIRRIRINGEIASEAYISAATAGEFDIPVVLVSGDDAFIEESRRFLGDVVAVETKKSTGFLSAASLTPARSRGQLSAAARQAMKTASARRPFRIAIPVDLEIDFKHRLPAELLDYLPCVERIDTFAIRYRATDMQDVNRFLSFILAYSPTLL